MSVKVVNIQKQLLSDNWYVLNKYAYDLERNNGEWVHQEREVYDRGTEPPFCYITAARAR